MSFIPYWIKTGHDTPEEAREKEIIGKVIYVDRAHKKFTLKYSACGGSEMKETFKFADIGKEVHIVRGDRNGR